MLRRDFILVQIEELGKVIVQMLTNRNSGAARKNNDLIQMVYHELKVDTPFLLSHTPEEIQKHLDREDKEGLARMEIAAKTLIEESYLSTENTQQLKDKAKEILIYIQQVDNTFSLERISLINQINI